MKPDKPTDGNQVITEERLQPIIDHHFGDSVLIADLHRLSGGASRETWSFDVVEADGTRHELVLRRDPGAIGNSADRTTEYELLKAAAAGGVAVPTVQFLLPEDAKLGAGFIMDRIAGETIPRKILRDDEYQTARKELTKQFGTQAALIHKLDVGSLPVLPVLEPQEQLVQYRDLLDALGEPHPAFELGLRWLNDHLPQPVEHRLVHGDFRNGNLVVGPEGLRAVLDWELSHLGDPIEDLGWCCVRSWRFGVVDQPVGGFGTREQLIEAYTKAGGEKVDEERMFFWEVLGTLKWGVICEMQAFTHLSGRVRSVELATLGRRIAETEWDLLRTIAPDEIAMLEPTKPTPSTTGSLHDRPHAAELLEAVREFIERDVQSATDERLAFHARVAVNALSIVERELVLGASIDEPALQRLADLLGTTGSPAFLITALAQRIRAGDLGNSDDGAKKIVCDLVRAKLEVANPRYLEGP